MSGQEQDRTRHTTADVPSGVCILWYVVVACVRPLYLGGFGD